MNQLERDPKQRSRVFISYADADRAIAERLIQELRSRDSNGWLEIEAIQANGNIFESIRSAIAASAYFLLLLSQHSVRSLWAKQDLESVLRELQSRGITLLPLRLEDCEIPPPLTAYQQFDMRGGIEENIERLAETLSISRQIDFAQLPPHTFEQLVSDLLHKLGFAHLQSAIHSATPGVDFITFRQQDPFGAETCDIYMVKATRYSDSRADLRTLRTLATQAKLDPKVDKVLLVTDGNLTSVALDWVNIAPKETGVSIRVIDGTELKRLLLQNTDLVSKYFSTSLSAAS